MLRILGSRDSFAGRLSRRDMLRAGGLGLLGASVNASVGASVGASVANASEPASSSFGQAKAAIILYLYGAPSQLETFDPKPDAPYEIRGDFGAIQTRIPGLRICEHLPRLSRVIDKTAVIRSMAHPYNIHSAAYTLTGVPRVDIPMELNPHDGRHWPFIGSVLDYLADQSGSRSSGLPRSIGLPFKFSSRCNEFRRGGPYAAFLGAKHDPIWTDYEGAATRSVNRWRGNDDMNTPDPFLGVTRDTRFTLPGQSRLSADLTLDRLDRRRSLLEQLDQQHRSLDATARSHTHFQDMALSMLSSSALRTALNIHAEPTSLRESYGMTLFGQATLAARRLIEAGSKTVIVFWDEFGPANSAWDTHFDHYDRLGNELLPGLDHALTALLTDLDTRGLLDTTLVACLSEHGRTPRISNSRGGGREHWSSAYCGLLAGGGIRGNQVLGRTDRHAAEVTERPISPKDVLQTMYHLLGISPETTVPDRLGRPYPLVAEGEVIRELI